MFDVVGMFAAEGISLDVFTGRVSAFNLIETLFTPKLPAVLPRLHIVVQYQRRSAGETENFAEFVELVEPQTGRAIQKTVQELSLNGKFHTSLLNLWAIRLEKAGDYTLRMSRGPTVEGPWTLMLDRIITLEERAHPLMAQP